MTLWRKTQRKEMKRAQRGAYRERLHGWEMEGGRETRKKRH